MERATSLLLKASFFLAAMPGNVFASDAGLPAINNVAIKLAGTCPENAEICPAVEPWTEIAFSFKSCTKMSFVLEAVAPGADEPGAPHEISILVRQIKDCKGPGVWRDYSLQVDSLADPSARYVILNPLTLGLNKF